MQVHTDQPQPELTPPLQPPKSSARSPLLWLGLGLLIVVVGGVYYFLANRTGQVVQPPVSASIIPAVSTNNELSPTYIVTESSTGWKKYTNTTYSFSMDFPEDWKLNPENLGDTQVVAVESPPVTDNPVEPLRYVFAVYVQDLVGSNKTPESIVDSLVNEVKKELPSFTLEERETITVDRSSAVYIIGFPSRNGKIEVYTVNHNRVYRMLFYPYNPSVPAWKTADHKAIFDRILSTFRFVEEGKPEDLLVLLPEWMPDVIWGEVGSLSSEGKNLGPVRTGRGISPTYDIPLSTPIEGELKKKDWEDDFFYAAGSPGGQTLGFSKLFGDKTYSVIIMLRAKAQVISQQGEPIQFKPCPCPYEISVSVQEKITE